MVCAKIGKALQLKAFVLMRCCLFLLLNKVVFKESLPCVWRFLPIVKKLVCSTHCFDPAKLKYA